MPKKAVIATDADENVVASYPSIKAAGRALNLKPSTINYRIRTGKYYNGIMYRFRRKDDYTPYTTMVEDTVVPVPSDAFLGSIGSFPTAPGKKEYASPLARTRKEQERSWSEAYSVRHAGHSEVRKEMNI